MAFVTAYISHVPDAEPEKHRCKLEAPGYKLFVRLVSSQQEAIEMSKELVRKENVDSILLCPGFSHGEVAEIDEITGDKTGIAVARSDGPGSRIAKNAMKQAEWF